MSNYILGRSDEHPPLHPIPLLPKCISRNEVICKTVVYAPSTVPWVTDLMRGVALKSGLDFEEDFLALGSFLLISRLFISPNTCFFRRCKTRKWIFWISGR